MKGSDFQETLDLEVQTAMLDGLKLTGLPSTDDARALAYYICSGARAGQREGDLIKQVYRVLTFTRP